MNRKFKILKIDHIAIAVNDTNLSLSLFKLLGMNVGEMEFIDSEKVNVVKIKAEDKNHTIELLESSEDSSVIKKFIAKKGEGLHHISFEVSDLESEKQRLQKIGFEILETSSKGANKTKVCFLHPKDTNGVLIELCEINHK